MHHDRIGFVASVFTGRRARELTGFGVELQRTARWQTSAAEPQYVTLVGVIKIRSKIQAVRDTLDRFLIGDLRDDDRRRIEPQYAQVELETGRSTLPVGRRHLDPVRSIPDVGGNRSAGEYRKILIELQGAAAWKAVDAETQFVAIIGVGEVSGESKSILDAFRRYLFRDVTYHEWRRIRYVLYGDRNRGFA